MPWTTLGLDPSAATEREVKRAYAKLLRTCRPDQDPEGFRMLHEAYQTALYELQWRSVEDRIAPFESAGSADGERLGDDTVDLPMEGSTSSFANEPAAIDLSPGLRAIAEHFDRLEQAFASGSGNVAALIEQAETLLYEHPAEAMRWGELMQEIFARHGDHPDLRLKADTIIFELEHGGVAATLAVIDRLDRKGVPQAIVNLSNVLLQNQARIATPAGGIVATRLAGAAAFWTQRHAEKLADFAYRHLARGERDFHMQLIDRHAGMAHLMLMVPEHLKSFWRQRMMRTAGRDTWDDEESKAAIEWLKKLASRGPCFDALLSLLPEDLAKSVNAIPQNWKPDLGAGTSSRSTSHSGHTQTHKSLDVPEWEQDDPRPKRKKEELRPASAPGVQIPTWAWGLIVVFVIKILAAVGMSTKSSAPPPNLHRLPASYFDPHDPENQRRIQEGERKLRETRAKLDQLEKKTSADTPPSLVPPSQLTLPEDPAQNPLLRKFQGENP